jgi:hypothetical protein
MSFSYNPFTDNLDYKATGGGGGGGITDVTALNSGSSVSFEAIGTTRNLHVSDFNDNTFVGSNSGGAIFGGAVNVGFGTNSLAQLINGVGNCAIGYNCLTNLQGGTHNLGIGRDSGSAYTSNESNNVCFANAGEVNDQSTLRLGNPSQTRCFLAGITPDAIATPQMVVVNPTDNQLAYMPIGGGGGGITDVTATNAGAFVSFETVGSAKNLVVTDPTYFNTFLGQSSGNIGLTDYYNNGFGFGSLASLTSGERNLALGSSAMLNTISAANNVALGDLALRDNQANGNVAIGSAAAATNTTGSNNVYIGLLAAQFCSTESNCITIGALINAEAGVSNQIVLGQSQTSCKIAGIAGNTISNSQTVVIDPLTNKLGTIPLSEFQASFSASTVAGVTGAGADYILGFDQVAFDTNGDFDIVTHKYTAPFNGRYLFTLNLCLEDLTVAMNAMRLRFDIDGLNYRVSECNPGAMMTVPSNALTVSGSVVVPMTAGQVCYCALEIFGGVGNTANIQGLQRTTFSGKLLSLT